MKQYKVTIGTISKGFREETYLLKDDVLKLIDEIRKGMRLIDSEELKSKLDGEQKQ